MQNPTFNGRYRILQQIGVGGFGLTYLAEDLQLRTRPRCVVKHLRPQITDAETMNLANRLFQQEAEILYRLGGHPNIPSLIAHFKERGEFFLVQEFIEGHTLDREFFGGKKYNQKEIIQFLGQTLEILSFVHSQKVIHRDLKPANLIRRSSDGNIFLIDFGAVKQVNAAPRAPQSNEAFASVTIGSHGYMPVEQMAGKPNFSSDLYALGLIAIEALTGIKPLDLPKTSTNEFMWAQKTQLSPELERFISKLVRMDFRQRYVSANEALAAFDAIAANIGFFNSRQQPVSVLTIQPIIGNQNFQPAAAPPIDNPQFIPPTVIVPTNNVAASNFPRLTQNGAPAQPKKSSGMAVFFSIVGIFFFLGFLFIAGKILNFRWSSLNEVEENPRQSSRQTNIKPSNNPNLSLYDEALKQAQEAAEIEKKATTKFEWEQIGNKYKRASALLASIEVKSPDYPAAQERIAVFRQKSDDAFEKMKKFSD
jgi:serine/threonine protein kinase